ncbi:MAG: hypothetical protein JXQ65_11660 [Candidatus Marinimicrobia bacterium]|nr:hypothetical protein [Candidatus Neomarinimicrobiota bacterium]
MIHDYTLLKNIYKKSDKNLIELKDHTKILNILKTSEEKGKGYKQGYTGFVFLSCDENNIYYCTMENFWDTTKDIELKYEFTYKRFDEFYAYETTTKLRKDAWQELKEVAGGYCRFDCIESGFIFYPNKSFSNLEVNKNGEIQCSKFSNPFLEFEMIPFWKNEEVQINRSIGKISKDFIKSKYFKGADNLIIDLNIFFNIDLGKPLIEISKNHYLFIENEIKKISK